MLRVMSRRSIGMGGCAAALILAATLPAGALTMKECSAKYKAEKSAGTLTAKNWQEFRKAECGAGSTASAPAAPGTPKPGTTAKVMPAPGAAPGSSATGSAAFPNAVSPKYAQESPGKARMHTCLDQYKANKASNGNGGLRWIQKGGGYYSECTKHLKGSA